MLGTLQLRPLVNSPLPDLANAYRGAGGGGGWLPKIEVLGMCGKIDIDIVITHRLDNFPLASRHPTQHPHAWLDESYTRRGCAFLGAHAQRVLIGACNPMSRRTHALAWA